MSERARQMRLSERLKAAIPGARALKHDHLKEQPLKTPKNSSNVPFPYPFISSLF